MIYVVATTKVKPEGRDDFINGHKACIAETRKEKGCISYEGHTSIHDPNEYVVVERWETRDDLNAHGKAPAHEGLARISAPAEGVADGDRDHQRRQGRQAFRMIRATRVLGQHRWKEPAGRYRRARFRRPAPAADGDDGHARPRIPARSRKRRRLARRRRAGAGRRPADRGGRGGGTAARDQGQRSASSDPGRLASRQPPSADADHAEGAPHPQGSRHRGDGEGTRRARRRDRGAVRSRRWRLCRPGARACA